MLFWLCYATIRYLCSALCSAPCCLPMLNVQTIWLKRLARNLRAKRMNFSLARNSVPNLFGTEIPCQTNTCKPFGTEFHVKPVWHGFPCQPLPFTPFGMESHAKLESSCKLHAEHLYASFGTGSPCQTSSSPK